MSADARTTELYVPQDVTEAQNEWGASCAPVAFAALMGVPVMSVQFCFPKHDSKPWANPEQLAEALVQACARNWITRFDWIGRAVPRCGLMIVTCPDDRKPIFDHCVAVVGDQTYDVNFHSRWMPRDEWAHVVMPLLNEFNSPRWRVTCAWEVAR